MADELAEFTAQFVVGGTEVSTDGKKIYVYYKLPYDGEKYILFYKPFVSARPGQVFEFTGYNNPETGCHVWYSTGNKAPKYIGLYEDETVRALLIARHAAVEARFAKEARIVSDKKDNALNDLVEPLRVIYNRMPFHQRAGFLWVIEEMITR